MKFLSALCLLLCCCCCRYGGLVLAKSTAISLEWSSLCFLTKDQLVMPHSQPCCQTVCHLTLLGVQLSLATFLCFSHVKTSSTVAQPSSLAWSFFALWSQKTLVEAFCAYLTLNEKHVCYDSKSHFTPNLISLQFLALLVAQPALVLFQMWQICADFVALTSFEGVDGPP